MACLMLYVWVVVLYEALAFTSWPRRKEARKHRILVSNYEIVPASYIPYFAKEFSVCV